MTIDQVRAVLRERVSNFTSRAEKLDHDLSGLRSYLRGKAQATKEVTDLLELIDGERGSCPKCGSSMGGRLPDGRWRCAGLSGYAVLACGHVYETNHGEQP